jgi:hypothetical protein
MVDAEASADRISVSAAYFTTASAATAPRDGSHILIKAGSDKSSAVAIRLNTGDGNPHSANVVLSNGSAIYSGAVRSGGIYEFIWSSSDTAWQIMNPQVDYASSAFPGVIMLATAAEAAAGTDVPKAVTPAQMADKFSAEYATTASAGLIELATTAEVAAGTNVSAAITPSTLHAYASAATTASAGLLEIATTAEATAGTDELRAITPATLRAVRQIIEPFVGVFACSASAAAISRNTRASTWDVLNTGVGSYRVSHSNVGMTSANDLAVNLEFYSDEANDRFVTTLFSASTSGFSFTVFTATSASAVASCNVHIIAYRISP